MVWEKVVISNFTESNTESFTTDPQSHSDILCATVEPCKRWLLKRGRLLVRACGDMHAVDIDLSFTVLVPKCWVGLC